NQDILTGPAYGGDGGDLFNDMDTIGAAGFTAPKSINIKKAAWMDSIQITYQTYGKNIREAPIRGELGGEYCRFDLDLDERIVNVTGASDKFVDALQFITNKGRISPYCGGNSGIRFTESHPGYIMSFISGRSYHYLDQIQFHWIREEVKYIMTSLNYDLNQVKQIQKEKPTFVFSTTLINRSPIEQKISYTHTVTTVESETWTMKNELTYGVTVSISCDIPRLVDWSVQLSTTYTRGFEYGQTKTTETTRDHTLEARVPANSQLTATLLALDGEIEVPYTTNLVIVYADGTEISKSDQTGTFTGVQLVKMTAEYGPAIPI
ncbi:unnamed protein product, partial [Rotaria sp. Silwood2]